MGSSKLPRRKFIRLAALMSAAASMNPSSLHAAPANPIPRWKGFNLLDFFSPDPTKGRKPTTEDHLQWMADWG